MLEFGWAATGALDADAVKIERLFEIGNFSVLEKFDQDFGEGNRIFVGSEVEEVFGKEHAVY